ncbi:MAG: hypothetical protein ABJN40_07365 [Sneathiella sp.]
MQSIFDYNDQDNVVPFDVQAARIEQLRNPLYEADLAKFFVGKAETATLILDLATFVIFDHYADGGRVLMANGTMLDLDRMESTGERFVYDCDGNEIFLQKNCLLIRTEDCFGESPRRTMNRFLQKAIRSSKTTVDIRLLPMLFWLDIARKILMKQGN